jgi:hypothetical protein
VSLLKRDDHRTRLRFARRELDRLAQAVERSDADEIEAGMRLIEAEERIEDQRRTIERQRIVIDDQQGIIESLSGTADLSRLGQIMRVWVSRAA